MPSKYAAYPRWWLGALVHIYIIAIRPIKGEAVQNITDELLGLRYTVQAKPNSVSAIHALREAIRNGAKGQRGGFKKKELHENAKRWLSFLQPTRKSLWILREIQSQTECQDQKKKEKRRKRKISFTCALLHTEYISFFVLHFAWDVAVQTPLGALVVLCFALPRGYYQYATR